MHSQKQSWKAYYYLECNGSENSSEKEINYFSLWGKTVNSSGISLREPNEPVYSLVCEWSLNISRPLRGCYLLPDAKGQGQALLREKKNVGKYKCLLWKIKMNVSFVIAYVLLRIPMAFGNIYLALTNCHTPGSSPYIDWHI